MVELKPTVTKLVFNLLYGRVEPTMIIERSPVGRVVAIGNDNLEKSCW